MDEKVNQRVMLTKRLIKDTLVQILREKGIRNISVRDLCEQAGINRTTFYRYYGSPYDVLSEMEEELLNRVQNELGRNGGDPSRQLEAICAYFYRNTEYIRILTDNSVKPDFPQKLFHLSPIRQMLLEKLRGRYDEQSLEFVITFVINGGYHMLREWLHGENHKPPTQIAALILELAEKVCR
jgi:AcrR family transcriptional regulator